MCLYGLRDAGLNFEFKVTAIMVQGGFVQGSFNAYLYHHKERDVTVFVHGDDFIGLGSRGQIQWFINLLKSGLIVKVRGILGPDKARGDVQEIICLNRIIRWNLPDEKGG